VAAVAFLFTLKEITPTSFYILDEIDAHCDDVVVGRLGDLLREMASGGLQVLVITLKHRLVEKADRVIGVYSRDGVSYVVSMPKVLA
jgi:chromosome segregation protein